jgi:hypothetical protein
MRGKDMRIEQVPNLEPGAGEVRLQVGYVGNCGSDLHYYADGAAGIFAIREPLIPGHELSGVVHFDPAGEFEAGTQVAMHPATWDVPQPDLTEEQRHLWAGDGYLGSASRWPHTPGGLAEQLVVRSDQVRRLPTSLPVKREASVEPLAVGSHALAVGGGTEGACWYRDRVGLACSQRLPRLGVALNRAPQPVLRSACTLADQVEAVLLLRVPAAERRGSDRTHRRARLLPGGCAALQRRGLLAGSYARNAERNSSTRSPG